MRLFLISIGRRYAVWSAIFIAVFCAVSLGVSNAHSAHEYSLQGPISARVGEEGCWRIDGPISGLETFWHGTKNGVTDVFDLLGPATNSGWECYTFTENDAGQFTRFAHVHDGTNHSAFTTNTLTASITSNTPPPEPSGGSYTLSGTVFGRVGEQGCWTITGPLSGLETFWHGTKNGVTDVNDLLGPATNSSGYCYTFNTNDIGSFTRFAHVRSGGNHSAFTTNTLTATVIAAVSSGTSGGSGSSSGSTGGTTSGGGSSTSSGSGSGSSSSTTSSGSGSGSSSTSAGGSTGGSSSSSSSGGSGSPVQPSINIVANPSSINTGGSSIITWNVSNAISCIASGGWSGARALSGSETVSANQTTTYSLTCSNGSVQASQSATVFVNQNTTSNANNTSNTTASTNNNGTYPHPLVSIMAVPQYILAGEMTTIHWSTTNAWFCTASDGWGGSKNLVGNHAFQLFKTTRFEIMCGNPSANISQEVTVVVINATAQPNSIFSVFSPNANALLTQGFVASCIANPGKVATGQSAVFAGGQSGGTGTVTYRWNGDVYGNGQMQNVAFGSVGTKTARLTATDALGKTAVATCSLEVVLGATGASAASKPSGAGGGATARNSASSKLALAVELEGDNAATVQNQDGSARNRSLLASVIPAGIRAISFSTAYLLFLTLVMFGIVAYLAVTRKKTSHLIS